jgi:hypothetical protein
MLLVPQTLVDDVAVVLAAPAGTRAAARASFVV